MCRTLTTALCFLSLAAPASIRGDEKKPAKDTFPNEAHTRWDVGFFEDSPIFDVIKRQVKGSTVTWVLENKRSLGTEIVFGYQAALLDHDGVKLRIIDIIVDPFLMNTPAGERNRFSLHLPPQINWKEVSRVVIKNGQFNN
jgi:hypothetical protein